MEQTGTTELLQKSNMYPLLGVLTTDQILAVQVLLLYKTVTAIVCDCGLVNVFLSLST